MKHDHFVDIKNMCCSAPVTYLAKKLKPVKPGEIVLVESNKVSMLNDIPAYCSLTKSKLIQQEEKDGLYYFWLRIR